MKKFQVYCRVFLFSASTLLTSCERQSSESAPLRPEPPLRVKTIRLAKGTIPKNLTLLGEIWPYRQATLYAKFPGKLKMILVDKGDEVKEGALLAEIEAPELLADLARARAELEIANIDYTHLSDTQKKAPELVPPLTLQSAKSRFEIAKANVELAEAKIGFTRIVAPFSGIVTRRMFDPGAFVPAANAGKAQSAALFTMAAYDRVRVQIAVPQSEVPLVTKGQTAKVLLEALPDRVFNGEISRLSYLLDESTRTMTAEIELENPKQEFRQGMSATVKFAIQRKEKVQLVPLNALVVETANAFVFTTREGRARKTSVRVGFKDETHAEILTGIEPDDFIIVPGKQKLADGQSVIPEDDVR